jgi:thiamine biosynthesis lipoprotein
LSCKDKDKSQKAFVIAGETQGTTYAIKYFFEDEIITKATIDSLFQVFDLSLSTYVPNSIVSKINRNEATTLDPFFEENFIISQKMFELTNGLFDPTIGTLVDAYGFGPDKIKKINNPSQIKNYLKYIGFNQLKIENQKLTKAYPEMVLDFNAIAQGYSVDVVANFLKKKGIQNALVEIGGEVYGFGQNLDSKKPWAVGIEDPINSTETNRIIKEKVTLTGEGLATSGNYRKIKTDTITGQKFVHIIHPKTGEATQTKTLSVTVISPSTAESDALATALMLMPIADIKAFQAKYPTYKVLVIYQAEDQSILTWKSF